jgi:hypothetical protein
LLVALLPVDQLVHLRVVADVGEGVVDAIEQVDQGITGTSQAAAACVVQPPSRPCRAAQQAAHRTSKGTTSYPVHIFLDATYCKARVDHQVVSQAVVVAIGVRADGHREIRNNAESRVTPFSSATGTIGCARTVVSRAMTEQKIRVLVPIPPRE